MINHNLESRIKHYIALKHEGDSWDFKRQWYDAEKGKSDLLHDIICMANLIQDEDGLIIIGIDENNDYSICDISSDPNRKNTHEVIQFLRDKKFDGSIRPMAHVENLIIDNKTIDVIVVENSTNVPFYLTERYQKVEPYHVYTRVGDSNTPIDKSAERDKVEKLWKKRFGIDKSPLQRFQIYLNDYENWKSIDGEQTFFYEPFPEFTIETEMDENRKGFNYYCFSQINSMPGWYYIRLKYYNNILYDTLGICLDGGRFFVAIPDKIYKVNFDYYYGYVIGTLQYSLEKFFLNRIEETNYLSVQKWNDCVPVFDSEDEMREFERFVDGSYFDVPKEPTFYQSVDKQEENSYFLQYNYAIALVAKLKKIRDNSM